MLRILRKPVALAAAALLVAGLGGCADSSPVEIPFPQLATIAAKEKVLSKDEKDAAIRELSTEQQNHRDTAIEKIEQR